jgi:hypothetical protein
VHVDEVVVEAEACDQELGEVHDERDEGACHTVVLVRVEALEQLKRIAWHNQTNSICQPQRIHLATIPPIALVPLEARLRRLLLTGETLASRRGVVDLTPSHLRQTQQ